MEIRVGVMTEFENWISSIFEMTVDGQTSRKNRSWLNVRYSPGVTKVQPRFSVSRFGIEAGPLLT